MRSIRTVTGDVAFSFLNLPAPSLPFLPAWETWKLWTKVSQSSSLELVLNPAGLLSPLRTGSDSPLVHMGLQSH